MFKKVFNSFFLKLILLLVVIFLLFGYIILFHKVILLQERFQDLEDRLFELARNKRYN